MKPGRKPIKDRDLLKVQVPLFIPKKVIIQHGGLDALRDKLLNYLQNEQNTNK